MYRDLKEFYWWPNIKKKNGWICGQMLCVSTSESGASEADEAFTTTFDTWMEVERCMDFVLGLPKVKGGNDVI
jgi:endonuclease III-like uncharacterized protein